MKLFFGIVKYSALTLFLGVLSVTVASYLDLPVPVKPLVVQTGSMSPSIPTGSLIVVWEKGTDGAGVNYVEEDVITFEKNNSLVSHRIVNVVRQEKEKYFQTKGDANTDNDSQLIADKDVIGKVVFAVPLVGKLVNFIKQPVGFTLLVVIPVVAFILSELLILVEEIRKKPKKQAKPINIYKPITLTVLCLVFVGSSFSYFSDVETSTNNTFSTASIFPGSPGSVVINEIMWMGSSVNSSDEWLELRNMTSSTINLSNWVIENAGSGTNSITIPVGKSIAPNGFFLIANDPKETGAHNVDPDLVTSVGITNNPSEQLVLRVSSGGTIIDSADNAIGGWFAGVSGTGLNADRSMERNIVPGDGTVGTNWHTATSAANIDEGAPDLATPRVANSLP